MNMHRINKIFAIVVTYNRRALLMRCLAALQSQTVQPDKIIVLDNASTDDTDAWLKNGTSSGTLTASHIRLPENVGGAGGFYEGIKLAIDSGAEWLWLMDDDGYPEANCLSQLCDALVKRNLNAISPVQVNIDSVSDLAFPVTLESKRKVHTVSQLDGIEFIEGQANLFNGLLISRTVFEDIGLPMRELFIRGDEVEFTKRMQRACIRFGTNVTSKFFHPSDMHERIPALWGHIVIRDTGSAFKNYYLFRNRAHAFKTDGNSWLLPLDFVRYLYYFIFLRKFDLSGFRLWIVATWDGIVGKLGKRGLS